MIGETYKKQLGASIVLCALTALLLALFLSNQATSILTVSFLDVGQGDSIFIETPSGRQILIDGGRDASVVRELASRISFWDKSIDIVVATHPDSDHIQGLVDVFSRYDVTTFVHSDVAHETAVSLALDEAAVQEGSFDIVARRGQVFDFGDGVFLTVLFPDRDVSGLESNAGSVVVQLTYGADSFLFTGDSPKMVEEYLAQLDGDRLKSKVLKIGHHGSKTSSSELFIGFVDPEYGILSRGCDNGYGHPHQEVLDVMKMFGLQTADTCMQRTITFTSDGDVLKLQ